MTYFVVVDIQIQPTPPPPPHSFFQFPKAWESRAGKLLRYIQG